MAYLSESEKLQLLKLARTTISTRLKDESSPEFTTASQHLNADGAAFVTLRIEGDLRGCIGYTEAFQPLHKTVADCAISAAFADPRFQPLLPEEYATIKLEISVLTPLVEAASPDEVKVGEHGLMIDAGGRRGLLLPQVATDQGWDRETFLSQTCVKAGLPPDTWKKPGTGIYLFEAEVFAEEDFD